MSRAEKIHQLLEQAFKPTSLEVVNDSHKHKGHAGHDALNGESHYRVIISADSVTGASRVEKHRSIHSALGELIPDIHALQIILK